MTRKTASSKAAMSAKASPSSAALSRRRQRQKQRRCNVIIESDTDIAAGIRSLRRRCRIMRAVHNVAGDPPLRRGRAGFAGLARIIVGQQLSIASAAAIWARTQALVSPFDAQVLAALSDDALRAAGLSRPKIRTLRGLAEAIAGTHLDTGRLDLAAMDALSDADVQAALTAVCGIGPWTADIYLMFCLGRADAFAPGDLALQSAAQQAIELRQRPNAVELYEIAETWRPWRSVAARLLWSYYAATKQPKSGAPV